MLVTAGVVFTDMVSGFFTQRIDAARTIDIGVNQSVIAGHVYAPLDMAAALAAISSILGPWIRLGRPRRRLRPPRATRRTATNH